MIELFTNLEVDASSFAGSKLDRGLALLSPLPDITAQDLSRMKALEANKLADYRWRKLRVGSRGGRQQFIETSGRVRRSSPDTSNTI